jgi:hypothetical protein
VFSVTSSISPFAFLRQMVDIGMCAFRPVLRALSPAGSWEGQLSAP